MSKQAVQWAIEERILEIVDLSQDITRSDLQGLVGALAKQIVEGSL